MSNDETIIPYFFLKKSSNSQVKLDDKNRSKIVRVRSDKTIQTRMVDPFLSFENRLSLLEFWVELDGNGATESSYGQLKNQRINIFINALAMH